MLNGQNAILYGPYTVGVCTCGFILDHAVDFSGLRISKIRDL